MRAEGRKPHPAVHRKEPATLWSFTSQRNCCSLRESVLISGLFIHGWQFPDIGRAGEARGEVWWRRGRVRETLHLLSVCALCCLQTLVLNRGSVGFTAPCITCRPCPPFIHPSVHLCFSSFVCLYLTRLMWETPEHGDVNETFLHLSFHPSFCSSNFFSFLFTKSFFASLISFFLPPILCFLPFFPLISSCWKNSSKQFYIT